MTRRALVLLGLLGLVGCRALNPEHPYCLEAREALPCGMQARKIYKTGVKGFFLEADRV